MGHQNCYRVTTAFRGGNVGENIKHLLPQLNPAVNSSPKTGSVNNGDMENDSIHAKNLKNKFEIIKNVRYNAELKIVNAIYRTDS